MLPTTVIAVLIAASAALSPAEKALLSHLHQAMRQLSDRRTAMRRFEAQVPRADAARCRPLQLRVPPNSTAYAETSFALAYYGIDYPPNIRRILRPYRIWRANTSRWAREYAVQEA